MANLVEGMSTLSLSRKPLNDLLKRLVLEQDSRGDNFINLNPKLCLRVLSLISDFEIAVSQKLSDILNRAVVESHIKPGHFSLNDLSYVALCQDLLTEENRVVLKEAIESVLPTAPQVTQEEMERFVLSYPDELTLVAPMAEAAMGNIQDNSNLVEVLVGMANEQFKQTPAEAKINTITCDGRVKASILFNDSHVVEIIENELVHYKKPGSSEWSLRKRGRLAQQLVMDDKRYSSYSSISYLELESAEDEREILNLALGPLFASAHKN